MMPERLRNAFAVARLILAKRRTRNVVGIAGGVYFLILLLAFGDLGFHGPSGIYAAQWVREPWALLFKQIAPFRFEAVALVEASVLTYLFAPVNLLIAAMLAFLVGLNIAFTYLAIVAPRICYGRPGAGVLASLPGLLAGWACCGPVILIVLGVQASASLIALFGWLLPIALALLTGTLVFNAGRTNMEYLREMNGPPGGPPP